MSKPILYSRNHFKQWLFPNPDSTYKQIELVAEWAKGIEVETQHQLTGDLKWNNLLFIHSLVETTTLNISLAQILLVRKYLECTNGSSYFIHHYNTSLVDHYGDCRLILQEAVHIFGK